MVLLLSTLLIVKVEPSFSYRKGSLEGVLYEDYRIIEVFMGNNMYTLVIC